MTSRRNILGLISLSTFLPFITKATEDTCSRQSTLERKSKEFEKWKNKVRYPVSESNESTVCRWQIQSSKEYLLTDLGWLVTLLFRGSILTDSGRLVFFLGVR